MAPRTKLFIVAAIVALFLGATATAIFCAVSYFQGIDLNRRASDEVTAKNYGAAIALCDAALRKLLPATERAIAYGNRGWCYTKKDMDDRAIQDFTESIRLDSGPVYSVLDRGLAYHRRGQFEKALRDYDTTLAKDPNEVDALYNRGLIFADRGEWARAIADFTEAIRCEPDNAQFFVDRGMAYASNKQIDPAIANFDAALGLNPTHAGAYIQRAAAYHRKGDPGKGLSDVTAAIEKRPGVPQLRYARAYIYLERGATDEALVDCNEALRLRPGYDYGYLARARAYLQMHDWEKARRDAEAALQKSPKVAWGHFLRGRALTELGKFDEAIAEFNRTLELAPEDVWAVTHRAENYVYRQEYSRARDDLRQAVKDFPNVAAAHLGLAWFLATCPHDAYRDGSEAIAEATKGCELSDWSEWYALDTLARAYAEHGDFDEAIRMANRALKVTGPSAQDRYLIENSIAGYRHGIAVRAYPPVPGSATPLERAIRAYTQRDYDRAIAGLNTILPPNAGPSVIAPYLQFFDGSHGLSNLAPSAVTRRLELANGFYYRALAYEGKKELDNAIADFSTALRLEPDSTTALRARGVEYVQKGSYERALADFDEVLRREPEDAATHCNRAEVSRLMRRWDAAMESVSKALELDPKLPAAYYTRGWVYRAKKQYDLALADFDRASQLDPNNSGGLRSKAVTLAATNQYAAAATAFRELATRFPNGHSAQNSSAWFLATCPDVTWRNGALAVIQARKACDLTRWNNPQVLDTLAAAYAETGDFEQAMKYANEALKRLPDSDPDRPVLTKHLAAFRRQEPWRAQPGDESD
jgi:tetratricopeptide (TPR) repeat protein